MSDFDERKILRRLNEISQIIPSDDATQRALAKVRQQMAGDTGLDEESDLGLEHKLRHKIFTIKRAIMTVAAVIVVALVITAGLMLRSSDKEPDRETAKTGIRTDERTVERARSPVEVEAFLEMIEEVFADGDVSEAVTLISQASDEQKDAAMVLLVRLMKERTARLAAVADKVTETPDEPITSSEDLNAEKDNSLTSDKATALEDDTAVVKEGSGVFSGIVIDEDGEPVAGATVHVKGRDNRKKIIPAGIADTDKDGIFVVNVPPNKMPLDMPVAIWSYVKGDEDRMAWTLLDHEERKKDKRQNFSGGRIPGDPGEIKIVEYGRACDSATGIVLRLEKAGRIFGTVTDTLSHPIEGANVRAFFHLDVEGGITYDSYDLWDYVTTTDKNGYYEVANLPALWDQTGWAVKVMPDDHSWQFERFRTDGPLIEKQVNAELLLIGITITGTVIDNYGNPLANRDMSARPDSSYGDVLPSFSRTDDKGKFWLERCAIVERLVVQARLSNNTYKTGAEEYKSFVYYPDVTAEVFIEADKFEYEVELVATLPEITIEVEVVDPNNKPLAYFPVMVTGADISDVWRIDENFIQRTDEDGQCIFTNVPETTGLKLIFAGDTPVPGDGKLNIEQKGAIEELSQLHQTAERVEVPILVVAGQKEYKVQARIPLRLNQDSPLGAEQTP